MARESATDLCILSFLHSFELRVFLCLPALVTGSIVLEGREHQLIHCILFLPRISLPSIAFHSVPLHFTMLHCSTSWLRDTIMCSCIAVLLALCHTWIGTDDCHIDYDSGGWGTSMIRPYDGCSTCSTFFFSHRLRSLPEIAHSLALHRTGSHCIPPWAVIVWLADIIGLV
jgi:hypothetical protein